MGGERAGGGAVRVAAAIVLLTLGAGACRGFDRPPDRTGIYAPCCAGAGSCIPRGLVSREQQAYVAADSCEDALLCVPREFLHAGAARFETCTASATGAEGRCVPSCLPPVQAQTGLRQDDCDNSYVCAPCFNPWDGASTGVCEVAEDSGPAAPPKVFAGCCGDAGRCIPGALVADKERAQLGRDRCTDADAVCVPEKIARDSQFVFQRCEVPSLHAEGRCLPACVTDRMPGGSRLEPGSCLPAERCAPCFDPDTGAPTGACELNADQGPTQSPVMFGVCCDGAGRCVPDSFVDAELRDRVSAERCEGAGELCIPAEFVSNPQAAPQPCTVSQLNAEGRCLPNCLPEVAASRVALVPDGCGAQKVCVPCFDPITGMSSGACNLGDDEPKESPVTFGRCCSDTGRCVPGDFVDAALRGKLGAERCEDVGDVCVPGELVASADATPPSCTVSQLNAEGRCLPDCFPQVSSSRLPLAQDGCDKHRLCVPCLDPTDASSTGACEIGRDRPQLTSTGFAPCCQGDGLCVPASLVDETLRPELGAADCQAPHTLCAPSKYVRDEDAVAASCTLSGLGAEGRCLSECLPRIAKERAQLASDGCGRNELCAPCYDPLDGQATGACRLGKDSGPKQPPVKLADCCNAQGKCVPLESVPQELRAQTGRDNCPSASFVCVPTGAVADPDYVPKLCRDDVIGAEGRCLPSCLPRVAEDAARLRRASCASTELCVPCFDPLSGDATGACTFSSADPGPTQPPVVFQPCCRADGEPLGVCVPSGLIPRGAQTPPRESCPANTLCVPREVAEDPRGGLKPCNSALTLRGACIQACFTTDFQPDLIAQGTCARSNSCVACELLGPVGVCSR